MKTPQTLRWIFILFFSISFLRASADNYFWVGGTGSWGDYVHHWATSSGGQLYYTHVPTPNDTVIFDSLSFVAPNDTVLADSAILYCYSMKWEQVHFHPSFMNLTTASNTMLKIYGSLKLDTGMTWSFTGDVRFSGIHPGNTVQTYSHYFTKIDFTGDTVSTWNLQDTLKVGSLNFLTGHFNSNGNSIYCGDFIFWSNNHADVRLDTSYLQIGNMTFIAPAYHLDADSTVILFTGGYFAGDHQHYGKVIFQDNVTVWGNNTFEEADVTKSCNLQTNNVFRRFFLSSPGTSIVIAAACQETILDTISFSGSCYSMNAIFGSAGSAISKAGGVVSADEVVLDHIDATGGATFLATNCFQNGNCSGWNFSANVPHRNLFWVGGSGLWNDTAHWSQTSGGIAGECSPTPADDIFIDANSFLTQNDSIQSSLPNIFCNHFHWIINSGNFIHTASQFQVYGDYKLAANMSANAGPIAFRNISAATIDIGTHSLSALTFLGPGSWNVISPLNSFSQITIENGSVNTNNFPVDCSRLAVAGNSSVQFNGSQIHCTECTFNQPAAILSAPSSVVCSSFSASTSSTFPLVIFPSGGNLSGNSHFGKVLISGNSYIAGNNIFDTLQFLSSGTEILLQAGSNQSISDELTIVSSCDAPVMMETTSEGTQAHFTSAAATINVSDIIMEDIDAGGGAFFNALNTVAISNVTGWTVVPPPGGPLYWIGGTGNWNDPNHWSTTSGGAPGICVPNPLNDVYFDANSFTGNADSVKINVPYAYCKSMDWTGSSGTPSMVDIQTANLLRCFGSFIIDTNVTASHSGIIFRSVNAGNFINTNNQSIGAATFDGAGGSWELSGDMKAGYFSLEKGRFKTAGHQLDVDDLKSESGFARKLLLDSSHVFVGRFDVDGDTLITIDADSSHLVISGNVFNGGMHNKYNEVTFTDDIDMHGTDTIHFARFMKMVSIHNDFAFDTLFLDNPGSQVSITSGTTQTLNGTLFTSATASAMIGIEMAYGYAPATLFKLSDTLCAEFLVLQGISATGGATFYAGAYSSDVGNNSGWQFQSCTSVLVDVWPGDANRDLTDDNLDLLAIGVAFGQSHFPRANASNTWVAQPCWAWQTLFANGTDIVNADCDGDGTVGYSDTTAVLLNYTLTHPARYGPPDSTLSSGYPLYFNTPLLPPVAGDTTSIGIMLGDAIDPALQVYGIAFTFHYNSSNVVPGSAWMDFTNSWMAPVGYEIHLLKHFPGQNKMEIAISRIDHQDISGQGEIARLHFRLNPAAQGMFKCWYTGVTLIDHSEIPYPVVTTFGMFPISVGINELTQEGFHAYPNPTNGNYVIDDARLSGENSMIEISDISGRLVQTVETLGEASVVLHLEALPAGTYFVRMTNEKGSFVERVIRE